MRTTLLNSMEVYWKPQMKHNFLGKHIGKTDPQKKQKIRTD